LSLARSLQGGIGKWKKAVGDKVSPGDIMAEIQTASAHT
jgi:pyruvate/2-oxoglutarate dehydrogenase complex dihydrolipoamide acyltransferase (E2) component